MTNATHIGRESFGVVRGQLVAVLERTEGRYPAVRYVDTLRPEVPVQTAPAYIFESLFIALPEAVNEYGEGRCACGRFSSFVVAAGDQCMRCEDGEAA